MKLKDGGFGPAYNVQLAVVGDESKSHLCIVGLNVSQEGNDKNSLISMKNKIEEAYGKSPEIILCDSDHATKKEIIEMPTEVKLIMPVPPRWKTKPNEEKIVNWKNGMETDEFKNLYKCRMAICERPNSRLKEEFGLRKVLVRGVAKVRSVFLLAATVFNILEHKADLL